jgi:uncharacterized protein (DUF924 family)
MNGQLSEKLSEYVLQFWFPRLENASLATMVRQWEWWFRGGADADKIAPFIPLHQQARRGEFNNWCCKPRSRLALIIILDQFSRTLYPNQAQAFEQDPKACSLALRGLEVGHYEALTTPWEKTFFLLPLGHSEDLHNLDLAVQLTEKLVESASPEYRDLLAFSASQARAHREIIARFGRHPHRNQVLGRHSTAEEQAYLELGQLVHKRAIPSYLSQSLVK